MMMRTRITQASGLANAAPAPTSVPATCNQHNDWIETRPPIHRVGLTQPIWFTRSWTPRPSEQIAGKQNGTFFEPDAVRSAGEPTPAFRLPDRVPPRVMKGAVVPRVAIRPTTEGLAM